MTRPRPHVNPCDRARRALHAWLDGDSSGPSQSVSKHLDSCHRCRTDWHLARNFCDSLPAPLVPIGLSRRIAQRVAEDRLARRRRRRRFRTLALTAAGLFLVALLVSGPDRDAPNEVATVPPVDGPRQVDDEPENRVRVDFSLAGRSVGTRVGRATRETVSETKKILGESTAERPAPVPENQPDWAHPRGPAYESLDDLGSGATVAFRPVTDSTRRAFGLVLGSYAPPPTNTPDPE